MSLIKLLADINSFYKDYPYANKYKASGQNPGPDVSFLPYAVNTGFLQKSLNFGRAPQYDRPGGGISDQPYFKVDTKKVFDLPMEDIGQTGGPDFYIRGGFLLTKSIEEDEIRLTNFFKSSKGVLWTVQQNILAKSSPVYLPNNIIPRNIYTPISTLAQAAGNPFGLHVNKMGLNPFASQGLENENSYLNLTKNEYNTDSTNRLTILYNTKINGIGVGGNIYVDSTIAKQFGIKNNNFVIINSTLGLYNRKRVTNTTKETIDFIGTNFSTFTSKFLGSVGDFTTDNALAQATEYQFIGANSNTGYGLGTGDTPIGLDDFRQYVPQSDNFNSFLAKSNYKVYNLNETFGISDNGTRDKNVTNQNTGSASSTTVDRINATSIYTSGQVKQTTADSDLIPFYFQVVNNNDPSSYEFIHFRAYIENLGDNFQSNWNASTYSGRGENFYIFNNFTRNVSLTFKVAVESQPELKPLYSKLNYLASLAAPDYSKAGYMRGNFFKLTVGDYLSAVPGFMTNLTYTIDANSPWNTGRYNDPTNPKYGERDLDSSIVPMVIDVQLSFVPVHNFLPRKSNNFITSVDANGNITTDGKVTSPFISLGQYNEGYNTKI